MRLLMVAALALAGCSSSPSPSLAPSPDGDSSTTEEGGEAVANEDPKPVVAPAEPPPPWPADGNLVTIESGDASEINASNKIGGDLEIGKLTYEAFARRAEPLTSGEPKDANVGFRKVTADGLVLRDVRCRLSKWSYSDEEMAELVTSGKIVAAVLPDAIAAVAGPLAAAKKLRACASGVAPRIGWSYSVYLVKDVTVAGVEPEVAACIEKAFAATGGPVESGACSATVQL